MGQTPTNSVYLIHRVFGIFPTAPAGLEPSQECVREVSGRCQRGVRGFGKCRENDQIRPDHRAQGSRRTTRTPSDRVANVRKRDVCVVHAHLLRCATFRAAYALHTRQRAIANSKKCRAPPVVASRRAKNKIHTVLREKQVFLKKGGSREVAKSENPAVGGHRGSKVDDSCVLAFRIHFWTGCIYGFPFLQRSRDANQGNKFSGAPLLGPYSDPARTLLGPYWDPARTVLGPPARNPCSNDDDDDAHDGDADDDDVLKYG